jgi:hypothetical protein
VTLEQQLAAGTEVRLAKREAQDILQKLRARGAESKAADRIEGQLQHGDEIVLAPAEAAELLEELKASGRRWLSGTGAPREHEPPRAAPPEPEPEPELERQGWFGRLFRR